MRALLLIILITLPFQIKKCNTILPQTDDVESSITIRTQAKAYFLVQLYRGFAEDGTYTKFLTYGSKWVFFREKNTHLPFYRSFWVLNSL